jgi:L-gulonate 5-dehydrogenase
LHTGVLAAVTQAPQAMEVVDIPEPPAPGPGEVVVGSMSVGICGSDYHFFSGHLTTEAGGGDEAFPKIQGHEVGGVIAAVGPECGPELEQGRPVALYPLSACGHCYPCRVGRPNTCDNFKLIGIHVDGGLQERLRLPQRQVFAIDVDDPAVAAMAEPVSIGVRALVRARLEPGERVVVRADRAVGVHAGAGAGGGSACGRSTGEPPRPQPRDGGGSPRLGRTR